MKKPCIVHLTTTIVPKHMEQLRHLRNSALQGLLCSETQAEDQVNQSTCIGCSSTVPVLKPSVKNVGDHCIISMSMTCSSV